MAANGDHSPLAQFEVVPLGGVPGEAIPFYAFTNSALFMLIAVIVVSLFIGLGAQRGALVPGRLQSISEVFYQFIMDMIRDNVGGEGRKYFPFIFTLFMFVLSGNLLGLFPYSFTFTSQIIVNFGLAFAVFIGVTFIGFWKHGLKFFGFFLPSGVPIFLAPLLIPIEILSYLVRPVSLALRLFANMTAGHTMLKVFASFVPLLGLAGFLPLALLTALFGLELLIALLQAYVFTVLTCVYLHDALHMH